MKTFIENFQYQAGGIAGKFGRWASMLAFVAVIGGIAFLLTNGIAIGCLYLCRQLLLA